MCGSGGCPRSTDGDNVAVTNFAVSTESIQERLRHYAVLEGLGHDIEGPDLGRQCILVRTLRDGIVTQEYMSEYWGELMLAGCTFEPNTASARLVMRGAMKRGRKE